jgi:hypothetical protein
MVINLLIEKNMKKLYYIFTLITIGILVFFTNCDNKEEGDTIPPAQITNVSFTPQNGGGYFTFSIPEDEDFLYVRGEYVIDNGKTISKTSSVYSDTLFIEGLGTVKEYPVKLYSVDRENNHSKPLIMNITPLAPTTSAILETVNVQPGFSSLVIDWLNNEEETVTVHVNVKLNETDVTKIYSSNLVKDRFTIDGLKGVPYNVSVKIRDSYDNETEVKGFGEVTPLIDAPLSKKQWAFLRDQLLYGNKWNNDSIADPFKQKPYVQYQSTFRKDSFMNAPMSHVEGRIEKFWDNEYDYEPVQNLNYFNTGQVGYPFSYYIDLGREVKASRFKIWQRNAWGMLYTGENVEIWEMWVSDDKDASDGVFDGWEYVGRYKLVKPSSVIDANNAARAGHEYLLYPENPRFTKPFRYLRYKAIKQFGGGNSGCTSEITIYGTEADGSIIEDPTVLTGAKPGWD